MPLLEDLVTRALDEHADELRRLVAVAVERHVGELLARELATLAGPRPTIATANGNGAQHDDEHTPAASGNGHAPAVRVCEDCRERPALKWRTTCGPCKRRRASVAAQRVAESEPVPDPSPAVTEAATAAAATVAGWRVSDLEPAAARDRSRRWANGWGGSLDEDARRERRSVIDAAPMHVEEHGGREWTVRVLPSPTPAARLESHPIVRHRSRRR